MMQISTFSGKMFDSIHFIQKNVMFEMKKLVKIPFFSNCCEVVK